MSKEQLNVTVKGLVKITDVTDGKRDTLVEQCNDIHPGNLAYVIAKALAGEANSTIYQISLGSGGTHLDAGGNLVYLPPNTTSSSANLYQPTYTVLINSNVSTATPVNNSVISQQATPPAITSSVLCTVFLSANEPAGQAVNDLTTTNPNAPYVFDELGIKTADGKLLTHLIFSPLEKTSNRAIEILYSLIISCS
jgi:hypothetical protein